MPCPEYSVFVSTVHSTKLTNIIWRIPTLADFMQSLTQEKENIVQIGSIKSTKYQSLSAGVSSQDKGKKKYLKQRGKEKKQPVLSIPSYTDGISRSKRRNMREREPCVFIEEVHILKDIYSGR